jgi:hypothetical protein
MTPQTMTITLEQDEETGELVLPLDSELLNQMGWDIGDTLLWEELPNGSWSITKEESELDNGKENNSVRNEHME